MPDKDEGKVYKCQVQLLLEKLCLPERIVQLILLYLPADVKKGDDNDNGTTTKLLLIDKVKSKCTDRYTRLRPPPGFEDTAGTLKLTRRLSDPQCCETCTTGTDYNLVVVGSLFQIFQRFSDRLSRVTRSGMILYTDELYQHGWTSISDTCNASTERNTGGSTVTSTGTASGTSAGGSTGSTECKRYFAFGIDRITRELTDTGGGIEPTIDKNIICTAIRETKEESLNVFDDLLPERLSDTQLYHYAYAVTDFKTLIIFWKVRVDREHVNREFRRRLKHAREPEVIGLRWFDTHTLLTIVYRRKRIHHMYSRVHRLLRRAGSFYKELP